MGLGEAHCVYQISNLLRLEESVRLNGSCEPSSRLGGGKRFRQLIHE
jgi:hypothetical protein